MVTTRNIMMFLSCCLLVGCSQGSPFNTAKRPPDEFMVISNPPLYIPPNFDLKDPSKLEAETVDRKENIGPSEKQFLQQIDEGKTAKEAYVESEEEEDKGLTRKFFSRFKKKESSEIIDPVSEKERIKKNKEEGKPINEGKIKTRKEGGSTIDRLLGNSEDE
jgi:hypothetical protein